MKQRLISLDNLDEAIWREKLDTRERISELINRQPTVEAIPVDWIRKYVEDNTQFMINPKYENTEFTEEPIDYYVKLYPYQIDTMLREWEKEK